MRHRKAGYKLGRTSSHRRAMLRNLAAGLFEHGQVVTTVPKAKALQPMVERIITLAKRGDLHAATPGHRQAGRRPTRLRLALPREERRRRDRERVERMSDRALNFFDIPDSDEVERNRYGEIRKSPRLVKHIFENVAPRFEDRAGGYTRIVKLGKRRIGDAAEYASSSSSGPRKAPRSASSPSGASVASRPTSAPPSPPSSARTPRPRKPPAATAVAEPEQMQTPRRHRPSPRQSRATRPTRARPRPERSRSS